MSFYQKYDLVKLISSEDPKTFLAQEVATGRQVFLHLLGSVPARQQTELFARLRTRPHHEVLDLNESDGTPYVVTLPIEGFVTLQAWLDCEPSPPPPPAPSPQPQSPGPGEFTRLFVQPQAPLPNEPKPAGPRPQAPEPGEFTRLFAQPQAPLPNEPKPKPESSPPRPQASGPGEFTRFFQYPVGANPLPVEDVEAGRLQPPPAPQERPFRGPSEFTVQFGPPGAAPAPPPAAAPPVPPGGASRLFVGPKVAPVLPQDQDRGPSEFTRVMRGHDPDRPQPAGSGPALTAPAAATTAVPLRPRSRVMTFVVAFLSVLVVVLLIFVIALLLRN